MGARRLAAAAAAVIGAALVTASPPVAAAQAAVTLEYEWRRDGTAAGTETVVLEPGRCRGVVDLPGLRVRLQHALEIGRDGKPTAYHLEGEVAGHRLAADARFAGDRVRLHGVVDGSANDVEQPFVPPAAVLDLNMAAHFALLARRPPAAGPLTVFVPQLGRIAAGSITRPAADRIEVRWGGLAASLELDGAGLARLRVPASRIEVVRVRPPLTRAAPARAATPR